MPARDRADLFAETAARKVLPEAIIEKDFWVCWMLKQLFSTEALSGRLLFKGGTSLSKIFHAISRFSEDIDLAVDYEALGFKGERDPRQRLAREGTIPAHPFGEKSRKTWRFLLSELDAWMKAKVNCPRRPCRSVGS